jgi:hypothetical protein
MDIIAFLTSNNIEVVLQSTWFTINEAKRSVNIWACATRCNNLALNPQANKTHDYTTMCSVVSGEGLRGHIELGLKAETKKLVIDTAPRDEFGCYLCKVAVDLVLRRPKWVMDELFRGLCENYSAHEAQKGTMFASRYMHCQRLKQAVVVFGRGREIEVETFDYEVSAWMDWPYGKA